MCLHVLHFFAFYVEVAEPTLKSEKAGDKLKGFDAQSQHLEILTHRPLPLGPSTLDPFLTFFWRHARGGKRTQGTFGLARETSSHDEGAGGGEHTPHARLQKGLEAYPI